MIIFVAENTFKTGYQDRRKEHTNEFKFDGTT
jgi:hypothetical protein